MLPGLVDERISQELGGLEVGEGEAFQPRGLAAREALQLRPLAVSLRDVDAITAAEAEDERRHPAV